MVVLTLIEFSRVQRLVVHGVRCEEGAAGILPGTSRRSSWMRLRLVLPKASAVRHPVRLLCTDERVSVQGAFGSRGSRGSGKSLMGSKSRGIRKEDMEALAQGLHQTDDELEAGDVLMEVLAEDHRRNRTVDFLQVASEEDGGRWWTARGPEATHWQQEARGAQTLLDSF